MGALGVVRGAALWWRRRRPELVTVVTVVAGIPFAACSLADADRQLFSSNGQLRR